MKVYLIKKKIQARSTLEAIKNESKAEITDVWIENPKPIEQGASAIGFEVLHEE